MTIEIRVLGADGNQVKDKEIIKPGQYSMTYKVPGNEAHALGYCNRDDSGGFIRIFSGEIKGTPGPQSMPMYTEMDDIIINRNGRESVGNNGQIVFQHQT